MLAACALLAFLLTLVYVGGSGLSAAGAHVALALGVFPLITAAMIYFTPVLTRSQPAPRRLGAVPILAMLAGALAVLGLGRWPALRYPAAILGMTAAAMLSLWMHRQRRRAVDSAHPGVYWYEAALLCLMLGLAAILAAELFPAHRVQLRRLHLHFNLLGFVGITAIGTLQVLIPTVSVYSDPAAWRRLRTDLKYVALGTILTASGAAWWPVMVWPGVLLWLVALARFLAALLRRPGRTLTWHDPALPLIGAVAGYTLALLSGALHALGLAAPRGSLGLFFVAFLLPLVTGAVSYLLPLWHRPGAQSAGQVTMRRRLVRGSALRALAFLASGLLLFAGAHWAVYAAAAVLALYLLQLAWALRA